MAADVEITVCRSCGWPHKKVRKTVKSLLATHGDRVKLLKESCLDSCKKDPAVRVGSKLLAPAKPKKIRKAVAKRLGSD